jgi:hypothetical protein
MNTADIFGWIYSLLHVLATIEADFILVHFALIIIIVQIKFKFKLNLTAIDLSLRELEYPDRQNQIPSLPPLDFWKM